MSQIHDETDLELSRIEPPVDEIDEDESESEYVTTRTDRVNTHRWYSETKVSKKGWLVGIIILFGGIAILWMNHPIPRSASTPTNNIFHDSSINFDSQPSSTTSAGVITPPATDLSTSPLLAQLCQAAYPQLATLFAKESTSAPNSILPPPPTPSASVSTPCVPARVENTFSADGPVNPISGCPANPDPSMAWGFYVGPQHNVRYPGNMQYLKKDVPFCHYSAQERPEQPTQEQLEGCLQKYREEFKKDPYQHTKLDCSKRRKVYDIWKFNDEHQILLTRLEEEYDYVDYFVIIESSLAFSNDKKELSFASNYRNYTRFMDKIIHVTCDLSHIPVQNDDPTNTGRGWPREYAATDCYKFALAAAHQDDIIIYGDTDEIPRPEVISALQMCSWELGVLAPPDTTQDKVLRLEGPRFVGSWKWQHIVYGESHVGNAVALRRHLNRRNGLWVDAQPPPPVLFRIKQAIWHCSWCFFGEIDLMVSKLTRWSELGAAKEWALTRADIQQIQTDCTKSRHPVFNKCRIWTNYDFLPKVIRDHPEKWKEKGFTV